MASLVIAEHDNTDAERRDRQDRDRRRADRRRRCMCSSRARAAMRVAEAAAKLAGVEKVLRRRRRALRQDGRRAMETLILSLAGNYDAILAPATTNGKNYMPRVAAKLDVPQISEILAVVSPDTFERPIYAGNAHRNRAGAGAARRSSPCAPRRSRRRRDGGSAAIEKIAAARRSRHLQIRRRRTVEVRTARTDLRQDHHLRRPRHAVGRQFPPARQDRRQAARRRRRLRAAVDAGFVPNDYQVGQTGKVVAPDLYIAVGISGAIQHLAGMKDSKVIAAINKDEEAPIFQVADYGLVADLFKAIPEMDEELTKLGY